jgi:hypothetical protein
MAVFLIAFSGNYSCVAFNVKGESCLKIYLLSVLAIFVEAQWLKDY